MLRAQRSLCSEHRVSVLQSFSPVTILCLDFGVENRVMATCRILIQTITCSKQAPVPVLDDSACHAVHLPCLRSKIQASEIFLFGSILPQEIMTNWSFFPLTNWSFFPLEMLTSGLAVKVLTNCSCFGALCSNVLRSARSTT